MRQQLAHCRTFCGVLGRAGSGDSVIWLCFRVYPGVRVRVQMMSDECPYPLPLPLALAANFLCL